MSTHSPHIALINTLTEFYTLLTTSGAIPVEALILPDPATGLHPPNAIASDAALAAGYLPTVVQLLRALPYLNVNDYEGHLEILRSTHPVNYFGADMNVGDFEARREMLYDELMPPSALKLTDINIHGVVFIYDVETKLVTSWEPFNGPQDKNDYFDEPAASPQEAFADLIKRYRTLHYLGTPRGMDLDAEFYSESDGRPPPDYSPESGRKWRAGYDVWAATQKIKDIYLECGWNAHSREQADFRRDEFLRRRDEFWEAEVVPLIEREEQT